MVYSLIIIGLNYRYYNEYSTMPRIAQTPIGFRIMPCHATAERSTAAVAHSVYSHQTAFSYSLFTIVIVVMAAVVSLSQLQCVCCLSVCACQRDEGDVKFTNKTICCWSSLIMYSGNALVDCSLACTSILHCYQLLQQRQTTDRQHMTCTSHNYGQ